MTKALLVVDEQNDFCEGGSLAVQGGNDVAKATAAFIREHQGDYDLVVFSKDWHEPDSDNGGHIALAPDVPDYVDTWPPHCIQGTPGAELHPEIQGVLDEIDVALRVVVKGMGCPAYSAFEGETTVDGASLISELIEQKITDLDVVGLATDHCVKASVMDALKVEFTVRVLTDKVAGVDEQRSAEALETMENHGAQII